MNDFWQWSSGKVNALVASGIYMGYALFWGRDRLWLQVLVFLPLPLGLIWFGEYWRDRLGHDDGRWIVLSGWILLYLPSLIEFALFFASL
jgi:hypothetical protein